jgi:hypothetical protein
MACKAATAPASLAAIKKELQSDQACGTDTAKVTQAIQFIREACSRCMW